MMNGSIVTAYLSHPIRGLKGDDATKEEMLANDAAAKTVGDMLSLHFPELDIYVPGDHDRFPQICLNKGYLTIEQILDVDVAIVLDCDLLLVYNPESHVSSGMQVEIDAAENAGKPIVMFENINAETIQQIAEAIDIIRRNRQ